MKALVHHAGARGEVTLEERPMPQAREGEIVLRVLACGVCRTDLHIVDEELAPHRDDIVPGHQIVGERPGSHERVGVSWLGGADGTCAYCRSDRENLCDAPVFTGYDRDGGYAEYVAVREDFTIPIPPEMSTQQAAPLLCAGVIGFRALRVAGVLPGEKIGLYGFGASAHLALQVLRAWGCEVFVATRGESHRVLAREMGAVWVGEAAEAPPIRLDRAITFAPAGDVVVAALESLRKGGVVAINAIHLDRMPEFDYDRLLWGERQIRSVANMTRADGHDFLRLAADIGLRPRLTAFPLEDGARALQAVREDRVDGAAVLFIGETGIPLLTVSRAFVKEDDKETEVVAKRPQRQHPYYVTPGGYEGLQTQLAAAQASADERAAEHVQELLDAAIVVRPEEQPPDVARFGAAVTVEAPDHTRSTYRIVGEDEADPLQGRISWLSPLAQALLEHRAGDRVVWQRPAGNVPLKIISISYGS